jgi:hypothetical protein
VAERAYNFEKKKKKKEREEEEEDRCILNAAFSYGTFIVTS